MGWQWHQLDHVQIICTSLQTDTTPVPHHSAFTRQMPFLLPNQQRQSTEGWSLCCTGKIYSGTDIITLAAHTTAARAAFQTILHCSVYVKLECGPMPNLMVALPNIGGALCSTPQSVPDAHY